MLDISCSTCCFARGEVISSLSTAENGDHEIEKNEKHVVHEIRVASVISMKAKRSTFIHMIDPGICERDFERDMDHLKRTA
jgi:hypothetical protein